MVATYTMINRAMLVAAMIEASHIQKQYKHGLGREKEREGNYGGSGGGSIGGSDGEGQRGVVGDGIGEG